MKLFLLLVLSTVCTVTISGQTGKGITYQKRTEILNASRCNPSEAYLKKKVKAQLANYYKDYPYIAVDFSSFKGQNGYSDKEDPGRIVYPFKIEMLVYLKRNVIKEGTERTEYTTWKYDVYMNMRRNRERNVSFTWFLHLKQH